MRSTSRFGFGLPAAHRSRDGVVRAALLGGLVLLSVLVPAAHAQQQSASSDEPIHRIETTDGQVLLGTLVSESEQEVVIDARELGEVTVQRENIESLEKIPPDRFRDGEYWFPNPQSTRYLFASNAIGIPEGRGYYQNTWIFFNNVNYGVSNHFSIGGGTVPIFLFGEAVFPFWVLPKLSVSTPQDNVHLAAGAVFGGVLGVADTEGASLLYGSATVGGRDHNVTLGLGYGYADGGFADRPAVNISGMTRVGRTIYLISENYFFPGVEDANLVSFGLRWAPENFAVDFALVRPLGETADFIGLPWLGVTVPFGQ